MEIAESFNQHVIEDAEVALTDGEDLEVRNMIRSVYEANQFDAPNPAELNVAVLCFVAGRAYEKNGDIVIAMSRGLLLEFVEFMVGRSEA